MRFLFTANIVSFFLLILVQIFSPSSAPERIFSSFIALFVIFALPAINTTAAIHILGRRLRSPFEALALATLIGLIVPAFILTIEYTLLGWVSPTMPIWNALASFLAIILLNEYQRKRSSQESLPSLPFSKQQLQDFFTSWPLFLSLILLAIFSLLSTVRYYALPDLDPYYWLTRYQSEFTDGTLTPFSGYRPLFSSLAYLFTYAAHIDFYAYFKYIIPFLSLFLAFPLALVATTFPRPLHKLLIVLSVFINGVTLMYLELPIPQAFSIIFSFYASLFLAYAFLAQRTIFYWTAGLTLLFSYFFHEAMFIPFVLFLLVTLFFYRLPVTTIIWNNPIATGIIALLSLPYLATPFLFASHYTKKILESIIRFDTNWLFPSSYINVDGIQMGWGDLIGIAKYYLFYTGPALFILIILFIFFTARKRVLVGTILHSKELLISFVIFLAFFSIAEVLPRLFNLSLLPERAWIFAGIFILPLLFFLLHAFLLNRLASFIIIVAFCINAGGALYINSLKQYLITDAELSSAEWIKSHLPENRIIFSVENKRTLQFYSGSQTYTINNVNFYFDESTFREEFDAYRAQRQRIAEKVLKDVDSTRKNLKDIDAEIITENETAVAMLIRQEVAQLQNVAATLESIGATPRGANTFYIYYAAPNKKNPYLGRPYYTKIAEQEGQIIFDDHPEEFKKVYSDEENNIFIWQIL